MRRRPYDHARDGVGGLEPVLVIVDEVPAWDRIVHLPPELTLEEAQEWVDLLERGEAPSVIVTGRGRGDGILSRAAWWLSWHEHLRVRRGVLFVVAGLSTWGLIGMLEGVIGWLA